MKKYRRVVNASQLQTFEVEVAEDGSGTIIMSEVEYIFADDTTYLGEYVKVKDGIQLVFHHKNARSLSHKHKEVTRDGDYHDVYRYKIKILKPKYNCEAGQTFWVGKSIPESYLSNKMKFKHIGSGFDYIVGVTT